jgi:hypothetical protein
VRTGVAVYADGAYIGVRDRLEASCCRVLTGLEAALET